MRRVITFLFCLFPLVAVQAQRVLTLEQCLQIAVENNLQVKLGQNTVEVAELTLVQKKFDFLPSASMNLPVNKSIGRSADIFTQAIAQSPWTSQPSITASVVAFRGLAKWNDLKQANYNVVSNQYSLEDLRNDIRLNTALAFFQCVFALENLKIAQARLDLLAGQMTRVDQQIAAGTKTEGDRFTLQAQVSTERVNLVNQQNLYDRSLLDLMLLLNLDPTESVTLQRPDIIDADLAPLPAVQEVFAQAKANNPAILKQQFKALAAKYAINSARANYFPTLNFSYGLTSFYSSNSRERIGFTLVDGFPAILYGNTLPMDQQFRENFSQSVMLSLNVPLFTRLSTRQNYLISKVNYATALLNVDIEQQDLYRSIQQAHLDATAAAAKLAATEEQLRSLGESYRYAEARYNAGLLDHYAYMEVLNNKTKAEIELLQARYDRLLKSRILDLYQGKSLQF